MSNISGALEQGQDRLELVRTELGRAREVMDRVDTGLLIVEDVLETTENVIAASRRVFPVVVVAALIGVSVIAGVLISRRRARRQEQG
jgi:hypothetical protein